MRVLILFAAPVAAGVVAATAAAANIAPNPGFESCSAGSAPAAWVAHGGTTIACDSTNPNSGSWSLKQTALTNTGGGSGSDCFASGIAGGTAYDVSFSYRTTDANLFGVALRVQFFSGTACTGFIGDNRFAGTPITRDGQWHTATGTAAMPANAQSANVILEVSCIFVVCVAGSGQTATANFDDVVVSPQTTTAAAFRTLSAVAARAGTSIRWRTASEVNVAGFNVYRSWHGKRVRVNAMLIPAANAAKGHSYRYLDRAKARGRARYWIEAVNLDATRKWYGPATVAGRS